MKVFISSLITGMEPIRAAARSAVVTLGHEPTMAEDFGALPHSPQVACLNGARQAGLVILILGDRYGATQSSGLSATHEEYREARGRCPILAFVQDGVSPEPQQTAFIHEVQAWDSGLIRAGFADPAHLERSIIQAIHRLDLASAATPFDAKELLARTLALYPDERGSYHQDGAMLAVAVAGGPAQAILRPSRIEDPALAEMLEKEALYGSARLFARGAGTSIAIENGALVLAQPGQRGRSGSSLKLDTQGGLLLRLPVASEGHMSAIIIETVGERLAEALRFAAWALDAMDATQRLSHIAVAAQLTGGAALRTRREHEASPNSMQLGSNFGREDRRPVYLTPAHHPRASLVQQADQLVEDLVTLIRRQWR